MFEYKSKISTSLSFKALNLINNRLDNVQKLSKFIIKEKQQKEAVQ